MKKVIFSVLMICLVAGLVGVGTWAYFSDIETSDMNYWAAGTLDLQVDGMDDPNVETYFEVSNVAPCDFGEREIDLCNVGSIAGIPYIHLIVIFNDDVSSNEPELGAGDIAEDGANFWDGELASHLDIEVRADVDGNPATGPGGYEHLVTIGKLSEIECIEWDLAPTAWELGGAGNPGCLDILIKWSIDCEVGNIIQSDAVGMNILFGLMQTAGRLPAMLELDNLVQPPTAMVCDDVAISVDATNTGGVTGAFEIHFKMEMPDASDQLLEPVVLDPGQTKTVSVTWHPEPEHVGVGTITVESIPAAMIEPPPCPIEILMPPSLGDCIALVVPPEVYVCDDVEISFTVHNAGELATFTLMKVIVIPGATYPYDPATEIVHMASTQVTLDLCDEFTWTQTWHPEMCMEDPEPYTVIATIMLGEDIHCFLSAPVVVNPPVPTISTQWVYDIHYDNTGVLGGEGWIQDSIATWHVVDEAVIDPQCEGVYGESAVAPDCYIVNTTYDAPLHRSRNAGDMLVYVLYGDSYYDKEHMDAQLLVSRMDAYVPPYPEMDVTTTYCYCPYCDGFYKPFESKTWYYVQKTILGDFCWKAHVVAMNATVEVPAGTFTDVVVIERFSGTGAGCDDVACRDTEYSPTPTVIEYWSPSVKGVVKVEGGAYDGIETRELTSYTP